MKESSWAVPCYKVGIRKFSAPSRLSPPLALTQWPGVSAVRGHGGQGLRLGLSTLSVCFAESKVMSLTAGFPRSLSQVVEDRVAGVFCCCYFCSLVSAALPRVVCSPFPTHVPILQIEGGELQGDPGVDGGVKVIDARLSCLSLDVGAPGWPRNRYPAGVQGPRSLDLVALTCPKPPALLLQPARGKETRRDAHLLRLRSLPGAGHGA